MDIEILIQSIMGLVALLAILILFLFIVPPLKDTETKNKKIDKKPDETLKKIVVKEDIEINTDFEYLQSIIKDKTSLTKQLRNALELIIKYHGTIHTKLGLRAHPDFDPYMNILFKICRHPNADKDMIINFDKELGRLNPEYKQDIDEAITRGLNSRRV